MRKRIAFSCSYFFLQLILLWQTTQHFKRFLIEQKKLNTTIRTDNKTDERNSLLFLHHRWRNYFYVEKLRRLSKVTFSFRDDSFFVPRNISSSKRKFHTGKYSSKILQLKKFRSEEYRFQSVVGEVNLVSFMVEWFALSACLTFLRWNTEHPMVEFDKHTLRISIKRNALDILSYWLRNSIKSTFSILEHFLRRWAIFYSFSSTSHVDENTE